MVKILFVHGMNHEKWSGKDISQMWFGPLISALSETKVMQARPELLPSAGDLQLLYWGDLFADEAVAPQLKGVFESLREYYYELVRKAILLVDRMTVHDELGQPDSAVAKFINEQIYQTAQYMANAPIEVHEPEAGAGVYDQIQLRFRRALADPPAMVIGHSLGSVIAYEGLCQSSRKVPTLLTIGSPIGVPRLIYDKLRPAASAPHPWPNVERWINVSNVTDAAVVPIPRIHELFRGNVEDVVINRGSMTDLLKNHWLVEYLKHEQVADTIAEALAASAS